MKSIRLRSMMSRYLVSIVLPLALFCSAHAFVCEPATVVSPAKPPSAAASDVLHSFASGILNPTPTTLARGSKKQNRRSGGASAAASNTALRMAKKKKAPAASSKIQVKMLKYVEGTGSVSTT
jgi:hypothetical protein